jgi:hypothetical protein
MTYVERLKCLKLITLERRRLEFDLTLCFKIMHGYVAGPPEKFGFNLATRRSRGHSLKLIIEQPRVDTRKFFFANRVAKPWNSLPEHIVQARNVQVFKRELRKIDFNDFLIIKM